MNANPELPKSDTQLIREDKPQNQQTAIQAKRPASIVWALILIALGVLFLLENLGVQVSAIDTFLRFLPVVLIVIGVDLIFRSYSWGASLTLIVALAAIAVGIFWRSSGNSIFGFSQPLQTINQPLETAVRNAQIILAVGVGRLELTAGSDARTLIAGDVRIHSNQRLERDYQLNGSTAVFRLEEKSKGSISTSGNDLRWNLNLAKNIPSDLQISSGVGETNINLTDLNITRFSLNSGVGRSTITFPATGQISANIRGGVGQMIVRIPSGLGAKIHASSGLGGVVVNGTYTRDGQNYTSSNYNTQNHLDLEISGGVGQIRIDTL
jgi:hypothetical protein